MHDQAAKNLLDEMERLELGAAALYDKLWRRFAAEHPAAGSLFYMLAVEERNNARAIAHFDRILRTNPFLEGLHILQEHDAVAAGMLLALGTALADTMDLEDALAFAWVFELRVGEGYSMVRQAEANPALGRLLSVLADAGHAERLFDFAREWGVLSRLPERAEALERRLAPGAVAAS